MMSAAVGDGREASASRQDLLQVPEALDDAIRFRIEVFLVSGLILAGTDQDRSQAYPLGACNVGFPVVAHHGHLVGAKSR